MKLGVGVNLGSGVKADQYSYIGVFIGFLDKIIGIILRAFGFLKNGTPYEESSSVTQG